MGTHIIFTQVPLCGEKGLWPTVRVWMELDCMSPCSSYLVELWISTELRSSQHDLRLRLQGYALRSWGAYSPQPGGFEFGDGGLGLPSPSKNHFKGLGFEKAPFAAFLPSAQQM